MLLYLSRLASLVSLPWPLASSLLLSDIRRGSVFHLPLYRREVSINTPRQFPDHGAIGLGDYIDVCVLNYTTVTSSSQIRTYNVLVQVGETLAPLVLGTPHNSLVMYPPDLTSQILALPIFGCSLALAPRTVSLLLSRYTPRPPSSRVALPFVLSTVTP